MRIDNTNFTSAWRSGSISARYVIQISFDTADTDHVYLTSDGVLGLLTDYEGILEKVSGSTQKVTPEKAFSTIGNLAFSALDSGLTSLQRAKLGELKGLKGKIVRLYVGTEELGWAEYVLVTTQIIRQASYKDGIYSFNSADIQRELRKDIFDVKKTAISVTLAANATTINVYDTTDFDRVKQPDSPTGITDAPGQTVGYIKLSTGCIVRYTDKTAASFTGCIWGVLDTQHLVANIEKSDDTTADNAPKVEEYIYLEYPAPMLAYAILTGAIYGYAGEYLPDHWHLGISTQFIRTSNFTGLGDDLWDLANFDGGVAAVVRGQKKTDGKKFISEQILLLLGCYSPIYSNGELGIRRRAAIISSGSYVQELNEQNVVSYSALNHKMDDVINNISLQWAYDVEQKEYRRINAIIDGQSIATHGKSKLKDLKFTTLHPSRHAYDAIKSQFDSLRDAYAGPPLEISVSLLPNQNNLEVGDIIRLRLDAVQDYTGASSSIDRNFEIQQVSVDWVKGLVQLRLFGSSQRAEVLPPDQQGSPIADGWYSSTGTEISAGNFPGAVTETSGLTRVISNITLAGSHPANGIFYCDQSLTIDSGITVTITDGVELRVKGFFQINGTINGSLMGGEGAAAGSDADSTGYGITAAQQGIEYRVWNAGRSGGADFGPSYDRGTGLISSVNKDVPKQPVITVDDNGIPSGIPSSLRGNGGPGGGGAHNVYAVGGEPEQVVFVVGGGGGNGGAGLLVVCRGADFGANGEVDTSGQPGANGTALLVYENEGWIKSGSGGGGAPGAVFIIIDGDHQPPVIDASTVTCNYGLCPVEETTAAVLSKTKFSDIVGPGWKPPYNGISNAISMAILGAYVGDNRTYNTAYNKSYLNGATGVTNLHKTWARTVLLTGHIESTPDKDYAEIPTALILTEATNTPATALGNISTIEASVTAPADPAFSYSIIQYRVKDEITPKPWSDLGPAAPEITVAVASLGTTYEFRALSVSTTGLVSQNFILNEITVINISTPGVPDIVLPVYIPEISLKGGGTEYNVRDANILFADDNYKLAHFAYYRIEIFDGVTLLRTETTLSRTWVYSAEKNIEDGINRTITVTATAVGLQGQLSSQVSLTVTNPAPVAPLNIVLSPGYNAIAIAGDDPVVFIFSETIPDYLYTAVYMSTSPGFIPGAANLAAKLIGYPISISTDADGTRLADETTYYFRLAVHDIFGAGPLSIEFSETTYPHITSDSGQLAGDNFWTGTNNYQQQPEWAGNGLATEQYVDTKSQAISGSWNWNEATTGAPGGGNIGGNAILLENITQIRISKTTSSGDVLTGSNLEVDDSVVLISKDRNHAGVYTVGAPGVDQGDYIEVVVTLRDGRGGNPLSGDAFWLAWIPQGEYAHSHSATQIAFDPSFSPLTTADVQLALDEVANDYARLDGASFTGELQINGEIVYPANGIYINDLGLTLPATTQQIIDAMTNNSFIFSNNLSESLVSDPPEGATGVLHIHKMSLKRTVVEFTHSQGTRKWIGKSYDGIWNGWSEIYHEDNPPPAAGSIQSPTILLSSDDLNNIDTPGHYYWRGQSAGEVPPTNTPATNYGCSMTVLRAGNDELSLGANDYSQTVINAFDGNMWVRTISGNNVQTAWRLLT